MSPIEHYRVVGGKLKASSKIELINGRFAEYAISNR